MDLDQGALSVEIELDDAHAVHEDDEAEDEEVGSLVLDSLDHVDGAEAEQDLRDLEVSGLDLAALCVRSGQCRSNVKEVAAFEPRVDCLEDQQEEEEDDRGPELRQTGLSLLELGTILAVFELLIDIVQLHVPLVDDATDTRLDDSFAHS